MIPAEASIASRINLRQLVNKRGSAERHCIPTFRAQPDHRFSQSWNVLRSDHAFVVRKIPNRKRFIDGDAVRGPISPVEVHFHLSCKCRKRLPSAEDETKLRMPDPRPDSVRVPFPLAMSNILSFGSRSLNTPIQLTSTASTELSGPTATLPVNSPVANLNLTSPVCTSNAKTSGSRFGGKQGVLFGIATTSRSPEALYTKPFEWPIHPVGVFQSRTSAPEDRSDN